MKGNVGIWGKQLGVYERSLSCISPWCFAVRFAISLVSFWKASKGLAAFCDRVQEIFKEWSPPPEELVSFPIAQWAEQEPAVLLLWFWGQMKSKYGPVIQFCILSILLFQSIWSLILTLVKQQ